MLPEDHSFTEKQLIYVVRSPTLHEDLKPTIIVAPTALVATVVIFRVAYELAERLLR